METKRNWALWGVLAGVTLGLGDYALFLFLGIDMQLADQTVTGRGQCAFNGNLFRDGFCDWQVKGGAYPSPGRCADDY